MLQKMNSSPSHKLNIEDFLKNVVDPWKVIGVSTYLASLVSEVSWWKHFLDNHEIILIHDE